MKAAKVTVALILITFISSLVFLIYQTALEFPPVPIEDVVSPLSGTQNLIKVNFANIFPRSKSFDSEFRVFSQKISAKKGIYGVYIKDLLNNKTYRINENKEFYAASLFKTPQAITAMRQVEKGTMTLETVLTYKPEDYTDGSGTLNYNEQGSSYTLDQVLTALLKQSDNVAQNMLLRTLPKSDLQLSFDKLVADPKKSKFLSSNISTPLEQGIYFENFYKTDFVSHESKKYLLELMSETSFDDRISNQLDPKVNFAHKIGNWAETGSWHDCGIVYGQSTELVVCVMSEKTTYEEFLTVGEDISDFINFIVLEQK